MKTKKQKIVTKIDEFNLNDEIAAFDYARIEEFMQVDGEWFCSVRGDDGAYQVSIKELRKMEVELVDQ
jgi:hypothetical protein